MSDGPITYWERRAAGEFERMAAERAVELAQEAAKNPPDPPPFEDDRIHVPLGAGWEYWQAIQPGPPT